MDPPQQQQLTTTNQQQYRTMNDNRYIKTPDCIAFPGHSRGQCTRSHWLKRMPTRGPTSHGLFLPIVCLLLFGVCFSEEMMMHAEVYWSGTGALENLLPPTMLRVTVHSLWLWNLRRVVWVGAFQWRSGGSCPETMTTERGPGLPASSRKGAGVGATERSTLSVCEKKSLCSSGGLDCRTGRAPWSWSSRASAPTFVSLVFIPSPVPFTNLFVW